MQCIKAKAYVGFVFALDYFEDIITLQNMHMYILTIVTSLTVLMYHAMTTMCTLGNL